MAKKRTKKQKKKILKHKKSTFKEPEANLIKRPNLDQKEDQEKLNKLFAYDLSFIFADLRKTILVSFFVTALLVIIYLYLGK